MWIQISEREKRLALDQVEALRAQMDAANAQIRRSHAEVSDLNSKVQV